MLTHGSVLLTYDGDGNRVSEIVGGTTTKFLSDDRNPTGLTQVLDEIVSGSVTRTYAYGLQRISENQLVNGTWTPSFYGYDGHGNVRFLTNSVGTITDGYDFDAFGMPVRTSGTIPNQFLYSGERYDSSVGLYDLRARYYSQATGRFWARDPAQLSPFIPATWNKYLYVADNPVNLVDPMGRMAEVEDLELASTQVKVIVPKYIPPASQLPGVVAGGPSQWAQVGGIFVITLAVDCGFSTIGTGINALYQTGNLGHLQTLYWNGWCNLASKPSVPQPEPGPTPSPSPEPGTGGGPGPPPDDPCQKKYLEDTAWCGEVFTDDALYDQCMAIALFNRDDRCRKGMPPINPDPTMYPPYRPPYRSPRGRNE
jgi:RHS repeat-associated protein